MSEESQDNKLENKDIENKGEKKIKTEAKTSFVMSLFFWIPLLNWGFGILAIYFGIRALKKSFDKPEEYGGRIYAVIGCVIGITTLIINTFLFLTILGVIDITGISQ